MSKVLASVQNDGPIPSLYEVEDLERLLYSNRSGNFPTSPSTALKMEPFLTRSAILFMSG